MQRNGPSDPDELARVASELALPADYVSFLREHDGAEGFVGENFARFLGVAELEAERASEALDHLEGWTVFGSNGAGEAFAFDDQVQVKLVPWIGARDDAIDQGSFTDFVTRLHADTIFKSRLGRGGQHRLADQ